MVISIGDQILNLQAKDFVVHSCFQNVLNFWNQESGELISIVNSQIGNGPFNIVVDSLDTYNNNNNNNNNNKINLSDILILKTPNATPFTIPIFNSHLSSLHLNSPLSHDNLDLFKKHFLKWSAPKSLAFLVDHEQRRKGRFSGSFEKMMVERFEWAKEQLQSDPNDLGKGSKGLKACVSAIKGLGLGLTPAGDDFICGLMTSLHLIHLTHSKSNKLELELETIYKTALGETVTTEINILKNSFLKQSYTGLMCEKYMNILTFLDEGHKCKQRKHDDDETLFAIGATSGSDWTTGLIIGIETFSEKSVCVYEGINV